ncbi:MAG TPA: hypothetical protein VM492_00945 [Sumerlaeia bacterium]|nr:hypothetical protein [Sumerlaeia bacterium]
MARIEEDYVEMVAEGVPRSRFVDIVAWIFIVMSSLAVLSTLLQNLMVALVFDTQGTVSALADDIAEMPLPLRMIFTHMRLCFFGWFLASLATLISSIGLYLRKRWARLFFIAIMAFGIIVAIGVVALQFFIFRDSTQVSSDYESFAIVMCYAMGLFTLFLIAVFLWIIRKLTSEQIREEFRGKPLSAQPAHTTDAATPSH